MREIEFIKALVLKKKHPRLKTMNKKGFAHFNPLKITQKLYEQVKTQKGIYADIGAAYGGDTLRMIKAGGHVLAIDSHRDHLAVLKAQVKEEDRSRLQILCQHFPEETSLEPHKYDGILLSRLLLFLSPLALNKALNQVYKALKGGGKIYVITLSPFSDQWQPILDAFYAHKALFPKIPFFVPDLWDRLPRTQVFLPSQLHLFDKESLEYSLEQKGFRLIEGGYESHDSTVDTCVIAQKPFL